MWLLAAVAVLQDGAEWLKSPEEAKAMAGKVGKPILLVTICAPVG